VFDSLTSEFDKEIDAIIAYPNNILKFIFNDNTIVEKEWCY